MILCITAPDQSGLLAVLCTLIAEAGGNIKRLDEHVEQQRFVCRIVIEGIQSIPGLQQWAQAVDANLSYHNPPRIGVCVSRDTRVLEMLLSSRLKVTVEGIWSNHLVAKPLAAWHDIPFYHIENPPQPQLRAAAEQQMLPKWNTLDGIILARYMCILTPWILREYNGDIINIHHSFLPSFKGAGAYQMAHFRGVKAVGATAHFTSEDLDEGPIIAQQTTNVSHRLSVEELKEQGSLVEAATLVEAVRAWSEGRVFRIGSRVIVF